MVTIQNNMTQTDIKIQLTSEHSTLPKKGTQYSAGYDLTSIEEFELHPMERHLFKTGIKMSINPGVYGRIAPRSGLAFKNGIDVMAGVIDSDYRGQIGVLLINLSNENKKISIGDKIAQIIFESCHKSTMKVVETLDDTIRSEGGFGSTDSKPVATPPVVGVNKGGTLTDLYQKTGGIPLKKKYSDEIRERTQ